jgi:hypothetical protein
MVSRAGGADQSKRRKTCVGRMGAVAAACALSRPKRLAFTCRFPHPAGSDPLGICGVERYREASIINRAA